MQTSESIAVRTSRNTGEFEAVRAVLRGDRAAFEAFYETWLPRVHAHFVRTVGVAEAERLTEQALTDVIQALERFQGDRPLAVWILARVRKVLS